MKALFPRWANAALRAAITLGVASVVGVLASLMVYVRTPWSTGQFQGPDQPVEFDHRHHVADDEIDCLYCHYPSETSRSAGVPSTELCMGCHAQVFNESPLLEPVRRSYFSGQPLPWTRVHDLGDFAYFDHAVHIGRGVGCITCHGAVDDMARVAKVAPLSMEWCLECHRTYDAALASGLAGSEDAALALIQGVPPSVGEDRVRRFEPMRGAVFEVDTFTEYTRRNAVTPLTTCTACHR